MDLALGIIIGILLCGFIYSTEFILNKRQTSITKKIDRKLAKDVLSRMPSMQGAILMPETDDEAARRELIEKNDRAGKPTKLSEL